MDAELEVLDADTVAPIDGATASGDAFALFAPPKLETFYRSPDTISGSLRLTGLASTGQAGHVYFDQTDKTVIMVMS